MQRQEIGKIKEFLEVHDHQRTRGTAWGEMEKIGGRTGSQGPFCDRPEHNAGGCVWFTRSGKIPATS